MRKKEGEGATTKPIIAEFESEKDKSEVQEKESDLRKDEKWEQFFFFELDFSREKRGQRK